MVTNLKDEDRHEHLERLSKTGWELVQGRDAIEKKFVFKDFVEAFGWMTKAAIIAEKIGHHPEWCNVYKTVEVTLTTHDVQGLSELDIDLAKKLDALYD